jgi:thiosulfate/3-mercaptopyruvate sulfurtransferase
LQTQTRVEPAFADSGHRKRRPVNGAVTTDELAARLGTPGLILLDVRTEPEFSGADGYACDRLQGHIPGARNLPLDELLDASPDRVRTLVGEPGGAEIIAYCHSGSRSAVAASILSAAGYEARNYVDSWHEWSRRVALPAE